MRNFNINDNSAKVYNNFEELKSENEVDLLTITVSAEVNNSAKVNDIVKADVSSLKIINLTCTIIYSNFNSLCSSSLAHKQTYIVIQNKSMTKIESKFDKVCIDLWELYHSMLLRYKAYIAILLNSKTHKT